MSVPTCPGMTTATRTSGALIRRSSISASVKPLTANLAVEYEVLGMPGLVGTVIVANSLRARGLLPVGEQLTEDQRALLAELIRRGALPEGASAGELREVLEKMNSDFRTSAPLDAAGAATIILDGVRSGAWRILVGQDAASLDGYIRAKPEAAYDYALLASMAPGAPRPGGLAPRSPGSTGNPDAADGGRVLP